MRNHLHSATTIGGTRPARCAFAILVAVLVVTSPGLHAAGPASDQPKSKPRATPPVGAEKPAIKSERLAEPDFSVPIVEEYCKAVRDNAAELRFAFQASHLDKLATQVGEQLVRLEARIAELKQWTAKRDAFANQMTSQLVGIFSAMRPESASEHLLRLDVASAAAILIKLDQRAASAILNDIPPDKAAKLTAMMVAASRKSDAGDRP